MDSDNFMLVIHEFTFSEYCAKHDDLGLEYDIDEAWENWQKRGPLFQVLNKDGKVEPVWSEKDA